VRSSLGRPAMLAPWGSRTEFGMAADEAIWVRSPMRAGRSSLGTARAGCTARRRRRRRDRDPFGSPFRFQWNDPSPFSLRDFDPFPPAKRAQKFLQFFSVKPLVETGRLTTRRAHGMSHGSVIRPTGAPLEGALRSALRRDDRTISVQLQEFAAGQIP
jgi:hypothetical protein